MFINSSVICILTYNLRFIAGYTNKKYYNMIEVEFTNFILNHLLPIKLRFTEVNGTINVA